MRHKEPLRGLFILVLGAFVLMTFSVYVRAQSPPNIRVNNYLAAQRVRAGRSVRAVVEVEIPQGFHIHSNRPLEKFLIATQLQIEAPKGVRVSAVSYPRAVLRSLKFSKNKVSVYEGKATMRFNVTVPASYRSDSVEVKARLRYQSCNDELCFRPENRDMKFMIGIDR